MKLFYILFSLSFLSSCASNKVKENPNKKINLNEIFSQVDVNNDKLIDLNESLAYSEYQLNHNYGSPFVIFLIIIAVVLSTCFFSSLISFLQKFLKKRK